MTALNIVPDRTRPPSKTTAFYNRNAKRYAESTRDVDMSEVYSRFLQYLKPGSRILDAGSGSGRDTLEFLKRGYVVEAIDASASLAELSSKLTGIRTRVLRFEDFDDEAQFDGIWSCAALLHIPRNILSDVLTSLMLGLTINGVLYASFKFGLEDRAADDGRHFTDLDEAALKRILEQVQCKHKIREIWVAKGSGSRHGQIMWLNAIIQRDG